MRMRVEHGEINRKESDWVAVNVNVSRTLLVCIFSVRSILHILLLSITILKGSEVVECPLANIFEG